MPKKQGYITQMQYHKFPFQNYDQSQKQRYIGVLKFHAYQPVMDSRGCRRQLEG